MALTRIGNQAITLDAAEIPNLDASKIVSGTIDNNRLNITEFDDNKIVNDISTLAIRQASNENKAAYNTNSMYVDVFQDSSGITNLTNVIRDDAEYVFPGSTSFSASAYETGDFSSTYTLTKSGWTWDNSLSQTNLNAWVNNSYSTGSSSTGWYPSDQSAVSGDTIEIAFGTSKYITGFRMYMDAIATNGNWTLKGSTDNGGSYTDLDTDWAWLGSSGGASAPQNGFERTFSNDTAFNKVQFVGVSGNWTRNPWQTEVQFKTKTLTSTINATGSFESNAITAPSSVNKMGAVITYQDHAGTNALNTDIVLKLSADGGSNYATATLAAMPDFASGIKMAKVNDLSVTAGTSLKYKIEFANQAAGSKEARIRGVSLQY